MEKIFMTMLVMLFASNLFADGDLFKVCFGTEAAERGELYRHQPSYGAVSVLQVQRGGVLGKMHKMFSSSQFVEEKIIFVKMDTNGFSDGSVLPSGLYRCTGTISYETAIGAMKTVPAFEKLSGAEENKIYQEAVEAEKRLVKERRERAIKEQPERQRIAESIIGAVDLNMGCIRIEKSIAPFFGLTVKNFMWKKLAESKLKGDCLTFLNVADDIVNDRDDYTERFDLLPDKRTMQEVCGALKKHRFKCEFSCNERLVFLVPNSDWVNFIASCKSGKIQVSKGVRQVLYCVGDSYSHYEPTGVLSYAHEENGLAVLGDGMIIIGVEGSVEKYSRGDLKNKAVALTKKIEDKEIPLSEFKDEMLSMDSDAWKKITAELISIPRGAELDRIRKADNELQAAKQKNARQEFVDEVSKLSFCLGDYIFFQKGLLEYTHSVTMDEQWMILAEFQTAGDWDGMARLVLGSSSDLSKAEQWVAAKKNLLSHEFKFTIFFTRDTGYYQRRKNGWAWRSFCFDDCLEISQKLDVSNPVYVYTSDRGDALFEEAKKSGFDILLWLNSHPADMTDHHIGGEFRKKSRPGSRDVSALLKHKDDALNAAKEDLSRFRRAVASVKWPPEYLVVTNVSVVGGKMVYNEKKKTFKIPQKVRGLALLLDNKDVVELYGKYCGGLELARFKEEWKKAGKKQESVYKKYKSAFDSIEKAITKTVDKACPKK